LEARSAQERQEEMKQKKIPKYDWPIVLVRWMDSASFNSGWAFLKTIPCFRPHEVTSMGFLFKDEKDFIVLIPHMSEIGVQSQDRQIDGSMSIPKSQIIWTRTLLK
jgi:hypothetical protein